MTAPPAGRADPIDLIERPRVADVVRTFLGAARAQHAFTERQNLIFDRITRCQTAAMGGHMMPCTGCGEPTPVYNSCRDRHCPQCQWGAARKWVEARHERILPVPYFHTVFTLPAEFRPLVAANPSLLYALLFDAAAKTLQTCARDTKRLGAMPAITLVLHTWNRQLQFHPHIHGVISAGGLTPDGKWKPTSRPGRKSFLFPVAVMKQLFKQAFLTRVIERLWAGDLVVPDALAHDVLDRLRAASRAKWHIYAKRPFAGAECVYRYLGAYTHRVGISNSRIIAIDDDHVRFHTKGGGAVRIPGVEFVRRFAQHILPKGFTRIRHYGLLAPSHLKTAWCQAVDQLAPRKTTPPSTAKEADGPAEQSAPDIHIESAAATEPRPHFCERCSALRAARARDPPKQTNTS